VPARRRDFRRIARPRDPPEGLPDEGTLLQIYAKHLGFEFRKSLEGIRVPGAFINKVPVHFARNYNLVALEEIDGSVLKVATCSPLHPHPMDDLAAWSGARSTRSSRRATRSRR
jgi:hypothetical protein